MNFTPNSVAAELPFILELSHIPVWTFCVVCEEQMRMLVSVFAVRLCAKYEVDNGLVLAQS